MEQVLALIKDYGLQILAAVVIGYLLGSISFSIIFTRIFDKKDIRTMGSGNAGFTNVLRSVGKLPSVLTFVCDFAKGLLAVYLSMLIFDAAGAPFIVRQCGIYLTGLACILGHVFPVFFRFKGGKGVLTSAALVLVIDWRIFLIAIGIFLIVFAVSKIISLASISAAASLPVGTFLVTYFADYRRSLMYSYSVLHDYSLAYVLVTTAFALILAILVVGKHHANIKRILRGEEKKITAKKRK